MTIGNVFYRGPVKSSPGYQRILDILEEQQTE
jgi:hypothetical protein